VASLAPAALAKGLADLTAIVTQAEALLRAQGTLKGDVHFAVERIHDVAMALRMRDIDSALCDTLDASVREVGDAVVRHEAAATSALSAAGLLRDVTRRIEDLTVVASRMVASEGEPLVRRWARESETAIEVAPDATEAEAVIAASAPVAPEAEASREARADEFSSGPEAETAHGPEAEAVDAPLTPPVILSLDDDRTRSLLYIASDAVTAGDVSVPETHAIAGPTDDAAVPTESPAAVALDPQQERSQDHINVAAEVPADKDEAASAALAVEGASTAQRVEAARAVPVVETASASAVTEAAVPVVPLTRNGQEPAQVASSPSVGESANAAATKSRRPANDPLAALYGLSEEELIALFS
jgi:hypothetical protein